MKKILSFFAMALVGLSILAQDCPTQFKLSLLNGDDAANVELETQIVNTSAYLAGFQMYIKRSEGGENIQWKKFGWEWFSVRDYLNVILANAEIPEGQDISDEEFWMDYVEVKGDIWSGFLAIKQTLYPWNGILYPIFEEPTSVGKICLDMSACEDGEYELRVDNSIPKSYNVASFRFPEGYHVWYIDEPMVFTLVKEGNTVTELRSIPASFAPDLSSISTIAADNAESRIYDLQGRELNSIPEHGVYIQNGKKHVK